MLMIQKQFRMAGREKPWSLLEQGAGGRPARGSGWGWLPPWATTCPVAGTAFITLGRAQCRGRQALLGAAPRKCEGGPPFLNILVAFPLSWCLPFTKSYVRTRLLHQQRWETRRSPVVLSEQNTLYSRTQWCSPSFHEGLLNALYLLVNVPGSSLSRGDRELPRYRAHIHHVSNGDMGIGGKSGREGEKTSSYMDIDLRTPSKSLCIYMCINLGVHCGD